MSARNLGFRLEGNDRGQSRIVWTGPVDLSADDLVLTPARPCGAAVHRAKAVLESLLKAGPCDAATAGQQAPAAGIAKRTLDRAKTDLGVESSMVLEGGKKRWSWRLNPASSAPDPLPSPEDHQRAIDEAQNECDALLAQLRAKYCGREQSAVSSQ
jgi:hypothetical protein